MTENIELIQMAIRQSMILMFWYEDDLRHVEPHLLGLNERGRLTLSAFQVRGGSGVGWRDFALSKMSGLRITGEYFVGPREGYNPNDSTMSSIIYRR